MTTLSLRKIITAKVNKADDRLLKLVNALIKEYESTLEDDYSLSTADKKDIDKRMKLYDQGKMKTMTVSDVKKKVMKRLKK